MRNDKVWRKSKCPTVLLAKAAVGVKTKGCARAKFLHIYGRKIYRGEKVLESHETCRTAK
jgi:hypothetical protein